MVRVRRAAKKGGGGARKKRGCEKKEDAPHPPFFKKGSARSTGTPPEYAYVSKKHSVTSIETYCVYPVSLILLNAQKLIEDCLYI